MSLKAPLLDDEVGADPFTSAEVRPARRSCRVSYEALMWVFFIVWALFCVVDRFVGPMLGSISGGFLPPSGGACPDGFCLGFPALDTSVPFTLRLFDGYQRATGRLFVAVTPFLLMTQTKVTENWFAEHHPRWLNLGDIRAINNRIHYQMALFFLAIPMVIHLFIIFVPVIAGVPLQMLTESEKPAVLLTPFISLDALNQHFLFFVPDDFLRLPLAMVTFLIILPLSVANWTRLRYFSVSHWLHIFGAAIYFMDFLRGNHPHAQVLLVPVFIWYFIDRMVGIFKYRAGRSRIIHIQNLDEEYCVIFMYVPNQKRTRQVGSVYYYLLPGVDGAGEFSHPYTSFQNHSSAPLLESWRNATDSSSTTHRYYTEEISGERGSHVELKRRESESPVVDMEGEEMSEITDVDDVAFFQPWNTAFIAQKFQSRFNSSFTQKLSERKVGDEIKFWGPYFSEYNALTPLTTLPPLVLIATGAGANFILDFFTWMLARFKKHGARLANPVQVYYSTNSMPLFQLVTDLLLSEPLDNFSVSAHLTRHDDHLNFSQEDAKKRGTQREMALGRLSLEAVVSESPPDAEVYFCGHPQVQWQLELLCATYDRTFCPGSRFSPHGVNEVHRINGKLKCKCTGLPCPLEY